MRSPVNLFICSVIRRARQEAGLTVEEMSKRTGIPLGSYSCLETGRYRMNLENLFRIIGVLGLPISKVWPGGTARARPRKSMSEAFIRRQVEKARRGQPPILEMEDVLEAVCQVFGLTRQELSAPSRKRRLAQARTVATLLVREVPHLTLVGLSQQLRRDVSSLSHCLRRMDEVRLGSLSKRIRQARKLLRERLAHEEAARAKLATEDALAEEAIERMIEVVCQVFEVSRQELAIPQGNKPKRNVSWGRAACAMLAREAAAASVQAVGRKIGFTGVQINGLDRRGRVWLRWAAQQEPPRRLWDVTIFRQLFEQACRRLGVDVERIAAGK